MNKNGFVTRVVVVAGFLLLGAAYGLSLEQTSPPSAAPPQQITPPPARPRNSNSPPDFFAGLTLTDDQKAKIAQIRADSKSHLEAVASDTKLSPDTKDAMLRGYRRMENNKIFEVLTPEQQQEVRRRMSAWRAAQQSSKHQLQQPRPQQPQPQPQEKKSQPE